MFIALLKKFNKKNQMVFLVILIITGAVAYLLARSPGIGFKKAYESTATQQSIWNVIVFICMGLLLFFPVLGAVREKILVRFYYRTRLDRAPEIGLQQVCDKFNLEHSILRSQFPEHLQKEHIYKFISRYLVD